MTKNTFIVLKLFLVCTFTGLTGCSLLGPVTTHPITTYLLKAKTDACTCKKRTRAILYVSEPSTVSALDTTDMAYSLRRYHIGYYAYNRWAATPSEMLKPLLIQGLQKPHYFKAVVSSAYAGNYDYVLNTEIINLIQDYRQRPPRAKIVLRAQILRTSSNRIIATKQSVVCLPMCQYGPYGGVVALNAALKEILNEIVTFSIQNIH